MKTLTDFISPLTTETVSSQNYEVIENETLSNCNLKNLTFSGSLFSLTLFKHVTFESCVFFATRLENCQFVGCKFVNCKFQFSNLLHSEFKASHFEGCHWEVTPVYKSLFSHCFMDAKTIYSVSKDESTRMENNFSNEQEISWEDILGQGKAA